MFGSWRIHIQNYLVNLFALGLFLLPLQQRNNAMAKKKNTADIGFEDKIWKAADVLRGSIDAAEYKNVVLGLIFLKYISDNFEEKHRQLVAEGDGFEEDKDAYTAENVFFVPAEARWEVIAENAHKPEIGSVIDRAMSAIERENTSLKGVLPKNFARPELDKRRLGDVVDIFTNNISLGKDEENKDLLGRTYEYCLAKFAQLEGKNAGEFYTPACVVRTLVAVIEPFKGRVYDPGNQCQHVEDVQDEPCHPQLGGEPR